MGRKKKEPAKATKKEQKASAKNVTNMNYYGHVDIKLSVDGKLYEYKGKNNGTYTLKSMLCMFLCGYRDVLAAIPAKLDLKFSSGGDWISCLNSPIVLTGAHGKYKDDVETNLPKAIFTATIKYSNLNQPIAEDDPREFRLYLLSEENNLMSDTALAYLKVKPAPLSKIQQGTDGIVEWTMEFLNIDEVQSVIETLEP